MSVILYEPGLLELLVSPVGPTSRYVTARSEAVAEIARENVRSTFVRRSGTLEGSIGVFPSETADGLECEIGTDGAPYGLLLEQGTADHDIYGGTTNLWSLRQDPDHPNPIYLRNLYQVAHPGFPPRPWLEPALRTVFLGG